MRANFDKASMVSTEDGQSRPAEGRPYGAALRARPADAGQ
jgi:hypothetical protein